LVFSKVLECLLPAFHCARPLTTVLQKPLDVGLNGVENVMCKYWFGLIFRAGKRGRRRGRISQADSPMSVEPDARLHLNPEVMT